MLTNILIFAGMMALFFLGAELFGGERRQMQKRIDRLKKRKSAAPKTPQEMTLRRKTTETKGIAYWLARPLPNIRRLGDRLERAGKTISPRQYVLRRLLGLLGVMFIISFIFKKSLLLGFFLGIILGVWLPLQFLKFAINKRSKAFLQLFPNAIDLIVRGLRSGLPVSESLVLVSHEVPDPVGAIFGNISNTMKLGVPMEKALQETAYKLDLTEFNFFTTSIVLQRETGGNLAEILNNLSEVLRGRFLMRMKIKAMSSEARASAYIIAALPFFVLGGVVAFSPAYLRPLIDDYRGNECVAAAVFLLVFGMWIMRRMTQFEI